jgi:hypothetical protein
MNIQKSIPLSYFHDLSDDIRLVEVLETLKLALQERPEKLDEQVEILIDHLSSIITNQPFDSLNAKMITEIGELGSHLLGKLYFELLNNHEYQRMYNFLAMAFAYWVVRNKGTINQLEFFVTALAQTANIVHDKISLESLYEVATFIVYATNDELKSAPEAAASDNPWRLLIMNYGIIATRTHTPELMESAYDTLIQYFHSDAPGFFRKAMSEMDRLNYPLYVRSVVERYNSRFQN